MSARSVVEGVLREAGLQVRGRRSDRPPMIVVRYGGLADDLSLRRHAADVWCCVQPDVSDPQALAMEVWDVLAASSTVMPVAITAALGVAPPGSAEAYDCAVIRAEALELSP